MRLIDADALALVKNQRERIEDLNLCIEARQDGAAPRVLTRAEVEKLPVRKYHTVAVVEEQKVPFQKWTRPSRPKWIDSAFAVEHYHDMAKHPPGEWYEYGKTCRYWTAMPSKKLCEATPWEE